MKNKSNLQSAFINLRVLAGLLLFFVGVFLSLLAIGALPVRSAEKQSGGIAQLRAAAKRMMNRRLGAAGKTVDPRQSNTTTGNGGASTNSTAKTQSAAGWTNTIKAQNNALGQTVYSISPSHFDISPPLTELAKVSLPELVEALRPDLELPSWRVPRSSVKDPVTQVVPGAGKNLTRPLATSASAPIGFNFDGVAGSTTGGYPPDTNGSVGNDQYVETVNTRYQVWSLNRVTNTATSVLGPVNINTLWAGFGGACQSQNSGDPVVLYDKVANRWLISQFTSSASGGFYYQCVAVSTTANAAGTFARYAFPVPNGNFGDYPKYGTWTDAYYVMAHNFTAASGGSYVAGCFGAMNRAKMLAGDPSATWQVILDPLEGGHMPADLDGFAPPPGGAPGIFVSLHGDGMHLYRMKVDFANSANTTRTLQAIMPTAPASAACGGGNCIPQPNNPTTLDSLADRMMFRLAYRNFIDHESLVISHSVDPNVTGVVSGVRWYDFRISGQPDATCPSYPCTHQQGTIADVANGRSRWMPSISMDGAENILVGYSATGTVEPIDAQSIRYTGRAKTDALNTMTVPETITFTGTRNEVADNTTGSLPGRWGDYSSMSSDPADDCTFWYANEYYALGSGVTNFEWRTRIASASFPAGTGAGQCQASTCTTRPSSAPTMGSVSVSGNNQITIIWTGISPTPGSYAIERAIGPVGSEGLYQPLAFVAGTTNVYTDTTVQGGVTYTYRVVAATDAAGRCQALVRSGAASATATGSCSLKPTFAGAISTASADTSSCAIQINWSAGASTCPQSSTVKYNIYRGTVPDFVPAAANRIASCVPGPTSYVDTDNLISGNTYYYVVRAEDNSTGNGGACGGNEETNNVHIAGSTHGFGTQSTASTWTDGGGDATSFLELNTTDPGNTTDPTWRIIRTGDDPGANHTPGGSYAYRTAGPGPNARYSNNLCAAAETPVLTVGSSTLNLTYWERHQTEAGWDGVAIEYSRNGGAWADVPAPSNATADGCMISDITADYATLACTGSPPINACDYPASKAVITGPRTPPDPAPLDCTASTTAAISNYGRRCHLLTGLTPGDTIQFRWRFTSDPGAQFAGFYLDDIAVTNIRLPNSCTTGVPLSLVSAASRLAHGSAGTFDVDLPLTGSPGIECRGGGNFTIALTFSAPVNGGTASVSAGNVSNVSFNGNQMIISLTGVPNAQVVTLTATNVTGQSGGILNSAGVNIGFLAGDTTGNGVVNSSDIAQTQSQSGQQVTSSNFREDVTVNGSINSSDIASVQAHSGTGLP